MKNIPSQFSWSQTESTVEVLLSEKYMEFCWSASTCAGPFPETKRELLKVSINKSNFSVVSNQFQIPAFEGQFKRLILPDESSWKFLPKKGIQLSLVKREEGVVWDAPFEQYEKEMYYKLYKVLNTKEALQANPEMVMLKMQVGEAEFKKLMKSYLEEASRPYEQNFEYLRTGHKLSQLIKGHNALKKSMKGQHSVPLKFNFNDVSKKMNIFSEMDHKKLVPKLMSEIEFGMNEGKFIFVKAAVDSVRLSSQQVIVKDSLEYGLRLAVYNLSQEIVIQEGTWMIIKEPFLKFGARDHQPIIRVDNVKEAIFYADRLLFEKDKLEFPTSTINVESRKRVQDVENQQTKVLIFNVDQKKLTITFMAFGWNTEKRKNQDKKSIFVERDNDWIGADIKEQKELGENYYEITFVQSVKSELFIECIKHLTEKQPGSTLKIWQPSGCDQKSVAMFLLFKSGLSFDGLKYFAQLATRQCTFDEILSFWSKNMQTIIDKTDELDQKEEKPSKSKNSQKQLNRNKSNEPISIQISEIMFAFFQMKTDLGKQIIEQKVHFLEPERDQSFKIPDGKLENRVQLLDSRKILKNLLDEQDQIIQESAIFYLVRYDDMLNSERDIPREEFSKNIIESKACPEGIQFDLQKAVKALNLIDLPVSADVVINIQRNEERQNLGFRNIGCQQKQAVQDAIADCEYEDDKDDELLLFCNEDNEIQSILNEFNENETYSVITMKEGVHINEELFLVNPPSPCHNLEDEQRTPKMPIEKPEEDNSTKVNPQISDQKQMANINTESADVEPSTENKESTEQKSTSRQETPQTQTAQENQQMEESKCLSINSNEESKNLSQQEQVKQSLPAASDSETLSNQSLYTVHSRETYQKYNEHWKQRLQERFKIDVKGASIKKCILMQVKESLNEGSSVLIKSTKHPDRYLLVDRKTKVHFLLKQTYSSKSSKIVYVPITVLTNDMKFK